MDVKGWEQLGGMLNRNAEIIGTYGAKLANSHAVNIVGLQFGQKLRIFGGGLGKLKMCIRDSVYSAAPIRSICEISYREAIFCPTGKVPITAHHGNGSNRRWR